MLANCYPVYGTTSYNTRCNHKWSSETAMAGGAAIGDSERKWSGKRFAVLVTSHTPDVVMKVYGGLGEMFVHMLSDSGETWDLFAVIEGEFPTDQELESYDGFVLTGSGHDAHGTDPWIERLCGLLAGLHEKRRKMLGICFGHQVLSRALGGTTGRSTVGWELGLKEITVSDSLRAKPYGLGLPRVLRILQSHRDAVSQVPPGGEVLGWSEKTSIEIFSVGEHVLGIQGHPEFGRVVAEGMMAGRLALGILTDEQVNDARKSMDEAEPDSQGWQKLCKTFLKGSH